MPKRAAAAFPPVASVGDDLLGDIFLRLPSTATLARAALACKRWRRVASDPALLRRFHSLHGLPPLLGFIMSEPPPGPFSFKAPDRLFIPAPSRNPHLAAAAAAAAADIHCEDFAAENPRSGSVINEWLLRGYDGGRFLLSYGFMEHEQLAVYDPIGRTTDLIHRPDIMRFDFEFLAVHYALLADEADASFRVVGVQIWNGVVTGAIFSSQTGEWAPLPSFPARPVSTWIMRGGMRAGRFAYWQSNARLQKYVWSGEVEKCLVLDTTAMEWTFIQLPFPFKESYCVADMAEHGGLCIVASKEQVVQVWVRDSNGGWVIKKQVSLLKQFGLLKRLRHDEWMKRVRILALRDGYVYMEFWTIRKPNSYLLVLNLEMMKLGVIANNTTEKYRGPAFPFFMTWAPPLLSPAEHQGLLLQGETEEFRMKKINAKLISKRQKSPAKSEKSGRS
ncbi:hypothetical protein HU200_062227 [Digitaria exilis]|uniref:F-box domain-containing protein n=1 Tax=Digitaria exilis TaxID=1010633 RepID=A0A835A996_9POAL|nr:hypothetical protein HU200_062227 [Digitaria exilis]